MVRSGTVSPPVHGDGDLLDCVVPPHQAKELVVHNGIVPVGVLDGPLFKVNTVPIPEDEVVDEGVLVCPAIQVHTNEIVREGVVLNPVPMANLKFDATQIVSGAGVVRDEIVVGVIQVDTVLRVIDALVEGDLPRPFKNGVYAFLLVPIDRVNHVPEVVSVRLRLISGHF